MEFCGSNIKTFKRYELPWRRFPNSDTYADLYDCVTQVNCLCNIRKPLFPSCKKKDMCLELGFGLWFGHIETVSTFYLL